LLTAPIDRGSFLLVECNPNSLWRVATHTIAEGWISDLGTVVYDTFTQTPEDVRSKLSDFGLNVDELEQLRVPYENGGAIKIYDKVQQLHIYDWQSAIFGRSPNDGVRTYVGGGEGEPIDLSSICDQFRLPVDFRVHRVPELRIGDDYSLLTPQRISEGEFVNLVLDKMIQYGHKKGSTILAGLTQSQLSEPALRRLEASAAGVIKFTVRDGDTFVTVLMNDARDRDPHRLRKINSRVILEEEQSVT
jgi:KaiC/GvpD/RAD55 family RecA-like ATPase